jgi:hypothetical protein
VWSMQPCRVHRRLQGKHGGWGGGDGSGAALQQARKPVPCGSPHVVGTLQRVETALSIASMGGDELETSLSSTKQVLGMAWRCMGRPERRCGAMEAGGPD